jgi:hypothetical protein
LNLRLLKAEISFMGNVTRFFVVGFFNGIAMGTLFFCIFCSYALSFWFGYQLVIDETENYEVDNMIAVSNINYIILYCTLKALVV